MQFMKTHLFAVTALLLGTAPVWSAEPNTTAPAAAPLPAGERGKVDINTADIPTLEAIPEIGTNFANAVVAARPFKSVEDLDRVLKLGPEKMAKLRAKVTASAVKTPAPTGSDPRQGISQPTTVNEGKAVDHKKVTERYDQARGQTSAGDKAKASETRKPAAKSP